MKHLRFPNPLHYVFAVSFVLLSLLSNAQVQTPRSNTINGNCGGYYEYLPQGYSSNTGQSYPLIVAVHGIGELGNGTTDLPNLLNCWTAIPRLIANGGFPSSVSVGGQSFSFIVIAPQFKAWPSSSDINDVVNYAVQNYRVDQSRIYVTGLSMGGGAVWTFAGDYPTKAAAVVPVCGAWSPDQTRAQAIANAKLPVWATHNQDDPTVSVTNTTGWVSMISQYGGNVISTIFAASGHDAWTRTYDPNFTQNGVNIYQWMLQHQKGGAPAPNQAPTANAGADQTITLPVNSVTLSGSGSDADGTIASYQWSQVSGPSNAGIAAANSASTAVNNLVQGSYVFRLTVTDNQGATASDDITINVNAAANQAPTANAGADQTITLPVNSVTLSGSGSDADGTIASYQWSQVSGPSNAGIAAANSASTAVNNLVQGSYVFRLTVTDNQGATASDDITINVNAAPNKPPTASAGSNQSITLPQNSVTLNGSATDPDGTIASYQWSQTSGPTQATIATAGAAATTVNNLVQGSYVFTLKVTDNKGASATATVTVQVNPAPNQPPVANAGQNQVITLPVNSLSLKGSGSDPDGTVSSYQWAQASGPSQATIVSANSANTIVNNLVQGIYTFTLTVSDNKGATAKSNVTVIVNQPPVANAGADQTITLPKNSITLSGTASDLDGTIASYQWSQVSGPSKADVMNGSSAAVTVQNLIQGTYSFRLTITDNYGATGWDEMTITVLPDPSKKSTASLYPNPANNFVIVKIDAVTPRMNSMIQITNASGNIVYTERFLRTDFSEVKQLDVSKLTKGIYFLTVTTDINTKTTLTLVKQ